MFAHPVRVTAAARVGGGDVFDIEREAELGGPIHSKGVMVLASFIRARYSRTVPLSLAAEHHHAGESQDSGGYKDA